MNQQPRWRSVGWAKRSAPIDWRRLMGPLRLAHPTRSALREGRAAIEYLDYDWKLNSLKSDR